YHTKPLSSSRSRISSLPSLFSSPLERQLSQHSSAAMAFMLRRPFAVSAALKQAPRSANLNVRFIHNGPFKTSPSPKSSSGPVLSSSLILSRSRQTFQNAFRRTYMQETYQVPQAGNLSQKILYGAAIVGGTMLAANLIFNRETREDGGMPPYEREYLNQTFLHTGLGVGIIAIAARALHTNGWTFRLMAANPWAVVGLGLVASVGTMYGTMYTPPEK
ncbi:Bax Inhibitor family protein, partial [Rasamsonia emersonii CBS 393.64]